jgi:hypothetical protein
MTAIAIQIPYQSGKGRRPFDLSEHNEPIEIIDGEMPAVPDVDGNPE